MLGFSENGVSRRIWEIRVYRTRGFSGPDIVSTSSNNDGTKRLSPRCGPVPHSRRHGDHRGKGQGTVLQIHGLFRSNAARSILAQTP